MTKGFRYGDLVWAKMKSFPIWPGKISERKNPPHLKKGFQFIYFFGTKNFAWIPEESIVPHSEEMINASSKKTASLQAAIDEIVEAAKAMPAPAPEEDEILDDVTMELSPVSSVPKTAKKKLIKKIKQPSLSKVTLVKVKVSKKRSNSEESSSSSSDLSPKIKRPNGDNSRVAVIRPYEEDTLTTEYIDRPCTPPVEVRKPSNVLKTKHVKATSKKIGFLGLGMMGRGIVKNLLNSGHHITVWNRTPEKCEAFIAEGALKGERPSDVVKASDIIFCCVSDPIASKSLVFGRDGVLEGFAQSIEGHEKGYVEMTSIDDETSQEIAEAISLKGGRYLEAPIIGSSKLAEEGTFVVLGSGDRGLFSDCETCFHAMAKHAYYISCDVGKSAKYSLIISTLTGTVYAVLAEAIALADRAKVCTLDFFEVLEATGLISGPIMDKARAMNDRSFATVTSLKNQQKDMSLGLQLSDANDHSMLVTTSANELYKHAKLLGYAEHDVASVYQGAKL